jgi:hypothetical protein
VKSRKQLGIGHMYICISCLEWPIVWPSRILTFPPGTSCIVQVVQVLIASQSNPQQNNVSSSNSLKKRYVSANSMYALTAEDADGSTPVQGLNRRHMEFCDHCCLFAVCSAYSSPLKMEAVSYSETSVNLY